MSESGHTIESVCSTCLTPVPAKIVRSGKAIFLEKRCPVHGVESVLESSTTDFYYEAPITPDARAQLQRKGDAIVHPLGPTCVALLEITDQCNLECPLCFASSSPRGRYLMSRAEFANRLNALIAEKGKIDVLMLSGGEPTVHPDLAWMLEWAVSSAQIGHVMLNTNGVLLARPGPIRDGLLAAWKKIEIYLQFDSFDLQMVQSQRGEPSLLQDKVNALTWLSENRFAVTFASTVRQDFSISEMKKLLTYALDMPTVRGVTFQPAFASGRHRASFDPQSRVTTPDVIRLICNALPDIFPAESFTNLPCSHPNCAIVGYFYRAAEKVWPLVKDIVPMTSIKKRINYNLEDLASCGCDTTELGNYVQRAELSADNSFRIVIKPFMDRFNLNRDRTAMCCTHVLGPTGETMSFCEYNVFRDQMNWNCNDTEEKIAV